jgi:hypothetical protein
MAISYRRLELTPARPGTDVRVARADIEYAYETALPNAFTPRATNRQTHGFSATTLPFFQK